MMGKLLLAPNFQLKATINLVKSVEVKEEVKVSKIKPPTKVKGRKVIEDDTPKTVTRDNQKIGSLEIEINL